MRRGETIGRGINNSVTAVCPVPSPSDSKGRCVGAGTGDGEGSVGGDFFFHTKKWGPPAVLECPSFSFGVFLSLATNICFKE